MDDRFGFKTLLEVSTGSAASHDAIIFALALGRSCGAPVASALLVSRSGSSVLRFHIIWISFAFVLFQFIHSSFSFMLLALVA